MKFRLRIWRQQDEKTKGGFVDYEIDNIDEHTSFLEMLDILNERLTDEGKEPVAFDSDCREGICGTCSTHHQRRSARAAASGRGLPALHA